MCDQNENVCICSVLSLEKVEGCVWPACTHKLDHLLCWLSTDVHLSRCKMKRKRISTPTCCQLTHMHLVNRVNYTTDVAVMYNYECFVVFQKFSHIKAELKWSSVLAMIYEHQQSLLLIIFL